ncbi:hypothetical protein FRC01_002409 [Tulasnella sp. 417]|nr:hypothetical protein FRC01_002409 [Tulasnella sp. 417]
MSSGSHQSSSPIASRSNNRGEASAARMLVAQARTIASLEMEIATLRQQCLEVELKYTDLEQRSKDRERVLNARLNNIEKKFEVLLGGMKRVKTMAIEKHAQEEEDRAISEVDRGPGGDDDGLEGDGEAAAIARSLRAAKHYVVRSKAIEKCISHLSNTGKATPAILMRDARYPPAPLPSDTSITYNDNSWSTDPCSTSDPKEKVFCLNFFADNGFEDVQNEPQIDRLVASALATGGARHPPARDFLNDIRREHLRPLVKKEFLYIAQEQAFHPPTEEEFSMDVWEERTARTAFAFEPITSPVGDKPEATLQEHPVGMVAYYWVEQGETSLAHPVGLWVHPAHRGKGLGSALVEWVVEQVLPSGTSGASLGRRLQLEVDERNKEVTSMSERLGFRKIDTDGRTMQYASPPGIKDVTLSCDPGMATV